MFRLDYLSCFLTVLAYITACAKIVDRTPCRNCQQLDRLCHWVANVTAWFYPGKPFLHLRIWVQRAAVAEAANTPKSRATASTKR